MKYRKWLLILLSIILLLSETLHMDFQKEPHKGLAPLYPSFTADFEKAGIEWWYVWSSSCPTNPPGCVPMSWGGEDPNLSSDYDGYLLFLNEPDRADQSNKTPADGVELYKLRKIQYPKAQFVVGNTFYPTWLLQFKALCENDVECIMPDIWGVHLYNGYREDLSRTFRLYENDLDKLPGSIWVTEFANVNGDILADKMILNWFTQYKKITRYAYFTNRVKGGEPWFPSFWNVALFDYDTGEPTDIGKWYMSGDNNIFHQYLPVVMQ
jgi:hypothetical protein